MLDAAGSLAPRLDDRGILMRQTGPFATLVTLFYSLYSSAATAQYDTQAITNYETSVAAAMALPYGGQSGTGATASTKTDLDSALKILLAGGDIGDIIADQFAEFDYNLKTNRYGTWKFRSAIETDAKVYPRLAAALDAAQQTSLKDQLASQIDTLDSYTIEILLSPEDKESVGRQANLLANAYSRGFAARSLVNSQFKDPGSEFQSLMLAGPMESDFRAIGSSLDNRGKMTFSAKRTIRSAITGPDETAITFGYERGLSGDAESVLRLVSANKNCSGMQSWTSSHQIDKNCISTLAAVPGMVESADKQERVAIKLVYSEIDSFDFSDQASMFTQTFEGTRSFSLSVAYGRNYEAKFLKAGGARLDASLTFEDVKGNADLNDRGLLQATYTLDFGRFEIPIALTWSNKSELVGDADAEFGGHIGIQFRSQKKPGN